MATVLVVDDEPSIVEFIAELVMDSGHTPITATNARDALILAQENPPALIISDVMMPEIDGITLVHLLRSDPRFAETMVILISAAGTTRSLPDEATVFAPKPLDLRMIEGFLQHLP